MGYQLSLMHVRVYYGNIIIGEYPNLLMNQIRYTDGNKDNSIKHNSY